MYNNNILLLYLVKSTNKPSVSFMSFTLLGCKASALFFKFSDISSNTADSIADAELSIFITATPRKGGCVSTKNHLILNNNSTSDNIIM